MNTHTTQEQLGYLDGPLATKPTTEVLVRDWTEKHNVTMTAEFVPFSKSRSYLGPIPLKPSLNWKITLSKNGREFLSCDYMQGSGHCPADKLFKRNTTDNVNAVAKECETGKICTRHTLNHGISFKKIDTPSIVDVLACIVSDASAIDSTTYEEFAAEYGYETDSRKGEAIYRECLEHGLKLRAAVGDAGLIELREATQDW